MRLGLQSRCRFRIRVDLPSMAWLIEHAAFVRGVCMVGGDGRTSYERRTGKRFLRPLPEICERIWYQNSLSEGKDKLETRWGCGAFAGVREESGEVYVLTDAGAIKVRGYKRRPEDDRRNQEELATEEGLPWEPVPGRSGIEV